MKLPLVFFSLMMGAASLVQAESPAFQSQAFEGEVTLKIGYRYEVALPDGYRADSTKAWPLVVFLHGAGERGNDLRKLQVHGPLKLIASGKKKFDAIVVAPQVLNGETWNPHGVKALVDKLQADYRVDASRIYLTGISMGGFGTWDTIVEYPQTFAAAVPICGGAGIGVLKFDRIKTLPLWIFHGEKDSVVPVEFSKMAMNFLQKYKGPVKLTVYPGVQHDSWTATYDDEQMWEWLLQQKRP